MVFSDPIFLFFFLPIFLGLYFLIPPRHRNLALLIASLLFYIWGEGLYVLVMIGSIVFNYVMGLLVDRSRGGTSAKAAIGVGVAGNIAILVSFKYANFIFDNLGQLLVLLGLPAARLDPVHLPIGISFFTFQAMSYLIDVYRGEVAVQRKLLDLALYKTLFPQLIAGPIVRYTTVAPEIAERTVRTEDFAAGVRRFILGLTKKVAIANPAGLRADTIFALAPQDLNAPISWLGVACYTIQIYFDFSGYSDMAIGIGRMLGFHFLENFEHPYISKSITEFWRRWHISLSSWFRDYLYIPLGGNRVSPLATYRNLLIVFILCGFWHGASWNFLIWGLLHGLLLVMERLGGGQILKRLPAWACRAYVLLSVMVGWVFFRAETLGGAVAFLRSMLGLTSQAPNAQPFAFFVDPEITLVLAAGAVFSAPVLSLAKERFGSALLPRTRHFIGFASMTACFLLCAVLVAGGAYNPFIYFRF